MKWNTPWHTNHLRAHEIEDPQCLRTLYNLTIPFVILDEQTNFHLIHIYDTLIGSRWNPQRIQDTVDLQLLQHVYDSNKVNHQILWDNKHLFDVELDQLEVLWI